MSEEQFDSYDLSSILKKATKARVPHPRGLKRGVGYSRLPKKGCLISNLILHYPHAQVFCAVIFLCSRVSAPDYIPPVTENRRHIKH